MFVVFQCWHRWCCGTNDMDKNWAGSFEGHRGGEFYVLAMGTAPSTSSLLDHQRFLWMPDEEHR